MNNLERDQKQYDVLVMETLTQEKTVRDNDWCVPVKHLAKLSRRRGPTPTKTNFTQWRRTRILSTKKLSLRFSSLTDADIEKGSTDLCELQQTTWARLPKSLVVDSGAGETVMHAGWLTNHPLTESDVSRDNVFFTQQPMVAKCIMKDKEIWMFAHLTANSEDPCLGKRNGDPWIAGKIMDDMEEFGYGGALVRIKSDQEPAIVDVQRAVIAKRGSAPTMLVNSPVGDPTDEWKMQPRRVEIW